MTLGSGYQQFANTATQAASQYGVPLPILQAVIQQESGWNPNAPPNYNANGTVDYGIAQLNSAYYPNASTTDPNTAINLAAQQLANNYESAGNWTSAVAAYNGSGPAAQQYAQTVMANAVSLGFNSANPFVSDPLAASGVLSSGVGTALSMQNPLTSIQTWLQTNALTAIIFVVGGAIILFSIGGLFSTQIREGATVAALAA
jgi:soluble lytic murein transglycosylase-like protein